MAREGNHSATLTVKGNARSANKEMQALARRQEAFERSVEKTNVALNRQARAQQRASKSGQGLSKSVGGVASAIAGPAGMVFAITGALSAYDALNSRIIDNVNVMTDLRFNVDEITAAMDNMTTGTEAARGAALLQSTTLELTQTQMNNLAHLTATVADKNKRDLVQSWDAVSKAIAKGNVDRLRAIGLNTDNAKLLDEVARATGRSTTQIGLAERQQIAYNEAMRALNEQAEQAGEGQDGLAFSFERMKNKAVDAFDTFGIWLNSVPQQLSEFGTEVERSLIDRSLEGGEALDEATKSGEDTMETLGTLGRTMVAFATLGMSELIPFLIEWETHLRTINGLMGDMAQIDMRGGQGGISLALQEGIGQASRELDPQGLNLAGRGLSALMDGANDAAAGLVRFAEEAEKTARESKGRRGGRSRPRAEALDRGFEGPTAVDSASQFERLDALEDARVDAEIAREQRRAEVVALRTDNNAAIAAADERGRLRKAEIAAERAQRDNDEVAAIQAADQREQAQHDARLRREREQIEAEREAHAQRMRLIEEERAAREAQVNFFAQQGAAAGQAAANIAFSMDAAARAARASGESEAAARKRAAGQGLLALSQQLTGKAIAETAEGVAGTILGNPLAARHFVAAGVYGAAAGTLGGIGRSLVGSGAGVGVGGATPGAGAAPAGPTSSGGGGRPPGDTPVPISRPSPSQTPAEDPTRREGPRGSQRGGGTTVINLNAAMVTPEVVEQITRQQRDQERGRGIRVGA